MIRPAALILALTAASLAAPDAVLVDGSVLLDAELLDGDPKALRFQDGTTVRTVATESLVSIRLQEGDEDAGGAFNLFLRNGDRLRGTVTGAGDHARLESPGVRGLKVPLAAIRAVRFGRLLGALQAKYAEVFAKELKRGRNVVIVQRETRPFPIYARVLEMREGTLVAMVGDETRELAAHKVYGFVRAREDDAEPAKGVRARLHLRGGGRLTLPLARISKDAIEGGGARVDRERVVRIEFFGSHIAHLSGFDPIEVKEVALFGKAPSWRRDAMVLGGPLRLRGRTFERGLGVQAYSRLEFVLAGRWKSFFVRCGIDDSAGGEGEATFRILGDGKVLEEVRRRRGDRPAAVRLDVAGVDRLVLEVSPGDSYISDFCDWAEARVFNTAPREGQ